MISCTCPHCQTAYELPDDLASRKVRCEVCQGAFLAPAAGATGVSGRPVSEPRAPQPAPVAAPTPARRSWLPVTGVAVALVVAGVFAGRGKPEGASGKADPAVAAPAPEPALPPDPAFAAAAATERVPDYPAALERAKATGNDILVLQRGSDWNRMGEDLHRQVWLKDEFLRSLGPGFVLVEVDRPEFPGTPSLLDDRAGAAESEHFRRFTLDKTSEPPACAVTAVTAASGAVYEARPDGAWLVQAPAGTKLPDQDTLTVTLRVGAGSRLLRLDFPPDPTLPNGCAGRASNGNFAISEITAAQSGAPVKLRAAWGSHSDAASPAAHTVDGIADSPDNAWNANAHTGKRRTLMLALDQPLRAAGDITLTILCQAKWKGHLPGCLRVAALDDAALVAGLVRHADATARAARNAAFDWQANWSVPRLALLDSQGRSIAAEDKPRPPFSTAAFAQRVRELRAVRVRRDDLWARAEKATGPEKAELLRQGLDALGLANSRGNGKRYQPVHEAIKAADPEDVSGAQRWLGFSADPKGGVPWAKPTWSEALDTQKGAITLTDEHYREALARVDKELADPRNRILPPEYIQRMMIAKYHITKRWKGHEDERFNVQREILALDRTTFWGIGAEGYLGQFKRSPMPYLSYGWGPEQLKPGRQTWELRDTSYFFAQPVPHRVSLNHRGGKPPLRVHRVALMDGDRVLAEASPNRDCGPGADAKVEVELDCRGWVRGRPTVLRVEVESTGETPDSQGSFSVEPVFVEDTATVTPKTAPSDRRRELAAQLLAALGGGDTPERLATPALRGDLALHELVRRAGDEADAVAARPGGEALLDALARDPDWLEALLVCDRKKWGQALENLRFLQQNVPGLDHPVYRKMGSAMALEAGTMNRYFLQDRFRHMQEAHRQGLLHARFDDLSIREMTWAVWLAGTTEDYQFMVDEMQTTWADYLGACWGIPYIDPNVYGYSVQGWGYVDPWVHHYGNGRGDRPYRVQRKVGGVCGTLSGYGAAAARVHGVMATTVGQPGHCAYVVRVEDQWHTGNDVSGPETNGASVFEGTGFPSMHRLYELIHADEARLRAASRLLWASHVRADRGRTEVRVRPGMTFKQYRLAEGKLSNLAQGVLEKSGPATGFDLAAAAPADTANLAIVWEGELEILGAGKPRVNVTVNEMATLTIGGQSIPTAKGWQEVPLAAGVHPVRLEYGNKGGSYALKVEWDQMRAFDPTWYASARRALAAQPENVPHWLDLAHLLEAMTDVPPHVWRECALSAAEGLAAWHEAGWSLANRFMGKFLPNLPLAERVELLLACHGHLRQENAPHHFGYNLGGVLDTHLGWLKEPSAQVDYFKRLLRVHDTPRPDARRVFGDVLAWGQRSLGGKPATAALFIPALGECFPDDADGKPNQKLGELILGGLRAAVEKNETNAYRLWRDLAAKRLPRPTAADLFLTEAELAVGPRPEPFPGALVSAEASLRLSSASTNDRLLSHPALLDGSGPGFFETNPEDKPWAQVQLAGEVEPTGVILVNRYESPAGNDRFTRSFPCVIQISTDGQTWTEVARVDTPAPFVRIDLQGKATRAKFIRIERASAAPARKMHFRNILVYGKKLY